MNMKYPFLFPVAFVLFLILSCVPNISEDRPNEEISSSPQWGRIQPRSKVVPPAPDAGIIALLDKNKEATNYHYFFDAGDAAGYDVFVKGPKAKKVYMDTIYLRGDIFYDTIYLDRETKTALATCETSGSSCRPAWHKAYPLDYGELYPTPAEIARQVRNPLEVGSEVLMNRQLTIIEYINADGKRERLSLDNFYGLPSRQVVYESAEEDADIEESHTFTRLSVGQVREEEVTLPDEYVVVG